LSASSAPSPGGSSMGTASVTPGPLLDPHGSPIAGVQEER
jgi:hypothetical protein